MTSAEKKKILGAYRWHKHQAALLSEDLEEQMTILRSPNLQDAPKGFSRADLADTVARHEEILGKLNRELRAEERALEVINAALARMDNEAEVTVLRLRYIKGLRFDKVAQEMTYSRSQMFRIHDSALKHFMEE